jgi:hypothetical protein
MIFICYKNVGELVKERETRQHSEKLILFKNLFLENIILSDKNVDFEKRLEMEEAARALNDIEIFEAWQEFTKSKTSEDVNNRAKELLRLLVEKTNIRS